MSLSSENMTVIHHAQQDLCHFRIHIAAILSVHVALPLDLRRRDSVGMGVYLLHQATGWGGGWGATNDLSCKSRVLACMHSHIPLTPQASTRMNQSSDQPSFFFVNFTFR